MFKYVLVVSVLLLAALWLVVRFMPLSETALHIDPETVQRPAVPGHVLVRAGGDIEPPVFEMPAQQLAARLEQIILATPRTRPLAGDLTDGFATYVTRSAVWGFPDTASVKVVDLGEQRSSLAIFSRLRYGYADMGVNGIRVQEWLDQLTP